MHAGLPEMLWPLVMDAFCFCVAWWWAVETCTGLFGLVFVESLPDPLGQVQAERLAGEQLGEALLFAFTLAALQQRQALLAQQVDAGQLE